MQIQKGGQLVSVEHLVSHSTADLGQVLPELSPASRELQVNQIGAILDQSAHVGYVPKATCSATQQGTERGREILPLLLSHVATKHVDGKVLRQPQQERQANVLGLSEVGQFWSWSSLACEEQLVVVVITVPRQRQFLLQAFPASWIFCLTSVSRWSCWDAGELCRGFLRSGCSSSSTCTLKHCDGFLGFLKKSSPPDSPLTQDSFLRSSLIEAYVDFLKDERKLGSVTCANHVAALLYPVKFVHREHGPEFKDVVIIQQLRAQVTILQREGDIERPWTREDLEALNCWITREEVVEAVKSQRSRFEATHGMRPKALENCDLLMLTLFVLIPPNRGLEIRTLDDRDVQDAGACKTSQRNLVFVHDDRVRLQFNNYKTKKFRGRDEMELKPDEEFSKILRHYVRNYRHLLATEASGQFLLLRGYLMRLSYVGLL
ncbi:uncharacterized protein [Montipora foliosa]|uniref:uncharacterized protein n=1 Tax=Montipora foliosa TaxID=591990 RepID=UPI0035F1AD3D